MAVGMGGLRVQEKGQDEDSPVLYVKLLLNIREMG